MAQHFLTPVAILVRIAYTRRLDMELDRGANRYTAHAAAKGQVSDALSALDVDSTEITTVLRAVYEMNRAERAGHNLSANRAISIAIYAAREDDLAHPSTVGLEPSTIYLRDEGFEVVLKNGYSARTPIMRRACPHGVYQPGWSRAQVLLAARRAGRVLP